MYSKDRPRISLLCSKEHMFSGDGIAELYATISEDETFRTTQIEIPNTWLRRQVTAILRRLSSVIGFRIGLPVLKSVHFNAQLGPDFGVCIPRYFFSRDNFIYMFDAWPRFHAFIGRMLDILGVKAIFFSSSEVFDLFTKNVKTACKAYFIPEGIDSRCYRFLGAAEKDIDLLEFGRAYPLYHERVVEGLARSNKRHIYLRKGQRILYPSRESFIEALSRTKIAVCIPSDITHPERAEQISTMTLRYLQCMSSKCLIIGELPREMRSLFEYIPIVPIDWTDPEGQILHLLERYEDYLPLIEQNYKEVLQKHQWINRWQDMNRIICKYL